MEAGGGRTLLGFLIVSDRDRSLLRCKALKKKKNMKVGGRKGGELLSLLNFGSEKQVFSRLSGSGNDGTFIFSLLINS